MAEELVEAAGERRTISDQLLRVMAHDLHLLVRFQMVDRGQEDPGPFEWLPGDPPPPKKESGIRSQMRRALGR